MLSWVEREKSFITSGPGLLVYCYFYLKMAPAVQTIVSLMKSLVKDCKFSSTHSKTSREA